MFFIVPEEVVIPDGGAADLLGEFEGSVNPIQFTGQVMVPKEFYRALEP